MRKNNALIPQCFSQLFKDQNITTLSFPISENFDAGILFIDISSFSHITEEVSTNGRYGVEVITDILSLYFSEMERCIDENNGDILKYGGDSIVAIFKGNEELAISEMINCKNKMLDALEPLNQIIYKKHNIKISIHGSLSWGNITLNFIGDHNYHLDYYITGSAVEEAFILGNKAQQNEIIIPNRFIHNHYHSMELQNTQSKNILPDLSKYFVHKNILRKLDNISFNAELRNCAVLFIQLKDTEDKLIDPKNFHSFYVQIQKIVYELDGSVNKIDYNDKGCIIILTFGVPNIHKNDIERAFVCGSRIIKTLHKDIEIRIGITYENIYAGIIGCEKRFEYGIIGNSVNTAARLMLLTKNNEITFTENINEIISQYFNTKFIKTTNVKGISRQIDVYKLLNKKIEDWKTINSSSKALISSRHKIYKTIVKEIYYNKNSIFEVTGKSETGKSLILSKILSDLDRKNIKIKFINLHEYNQKISNYLLISLFAEKYNIENILHNLDDLTNYCVRKNINFDKKILADFLNNDIDQIAEDSKEKIEIAYEIISSIILEILDDIKLIAFDNLHWLDSVSFNILKYLIPKLIQKKCFLIYTSDKKLDFSSFENRLNSSELSFLDIQQTEEILRQEFGSITRDAIDAIFTLTKGNPLFIDKISEKIKENFDLKTVILNSSILDILIKNRKISSSIENIFLTEYEKLDKSTKHIIKIASIMGSKFNYDIINNLLPEVDEADLNSSLSELVDKNILRKIENFPEIEYFFSNNLMREAIYISIPLNEKKELHNIIANYLIEKYKMKISDFILIIASHFIAAQNKIFGTKYSITAAENAFNHSNYSISLYYLEAAKNLTNDKAKLNKINLLEIENFIKLGDFSKASDKLNKLSDSIHSDKELNDKFIFLKTKSYLLQQNNHELIKFVNSNIDLVASKHYKNLMMLHYFEALRALSEITLFKEKVFTFLEQLKKDNSEILLSKLLGIIGLFYLDQGAYKEAKKYYQEQLDLSEKAEDSYSMRVAITSLGILSSKLGDKEEAQILYKKALNFAEKMGDKNGASKVLSDLGNLSSQLGKREEAFGYYNRSLELAKLVGNKIQEQTALYGISREYLYMQQYDKALQYLNLCKEICENLSYKIGLSFVQDAIGDCYFYLEKYDLAREVYLQNLALQKALNDQEGLGHTYGNLGNIAKDYDKDYPTAIEYYKKQIHILGNVGDLDGEGRAYFNWANVCFEMGDLTESINKFEKALSNFEKCKIDIYIQASKDAIAYVKSQMDDK